MFPQEVYWHYDLDGSKYFLDFDRRGKLTNMTTAPVTIDANDLDSLSAKAPIDGFSTIMQLKSWTVQEYYRMSELGILDAAERTELIAGQIVLMVAKGTPHVLTLRLLASELEAVLGNRPAFLSTQDPIHLDNFSEPEPDLAIVKGHALDYVEQHPQPQDIYLVVEVADSTLKQDCEVKDKIYAQAGIVDYWVVDIPHRQVHVFRDPTLTGYANHFVLNESQMVSSLAFPDIALSILSVLPPS
jgi:Uma2 family endonuclease